MAGLTAQQAGQKFTVAYLKFLKVFNGELKIYGGEQQGQARRPPLAGLLQVPPALEKHLLDLKDSKGQPLESKRSNIQVFGAVKVVKGHVVLLLDKVLKLETQLERFERLAAALPPKDAEKRRSLAWSIEGAVRHYPDDRAALQPLVERLRQEAREITIEQLPPLPQGAEQRIEVGLRVKDIELVAEVWSHPEVSAELRERARQTLVERLQARLSHGKWYPYAELKRRLGFVTLDRRWVRQERGWLDEMVAREKERLKRNEPRQPFTGPMMASQVAEGKILRGVSKSDVISAMKVQTGELTYPELAFRYREPQQNGGDVVWEVWLFPSGFQVYFCNGLVTEKFNPAEEEGEEKKPRPEDGK
ncbi:MAG: hypothetical protein AB7N76_25515 [Planctomycetota bacterium]